MTAIEMLAEIQRQGVAVEVSGGELVFRNGKRVLTGKLLADVKQAKPELLAILADPEAAELSPYGLVRCSTCRRILVARHLQATPTPGRYSCRDWADCHAAVEAAKQYGKQ